jgi:hypothetical protein
MTKITDLQRGILAQVESMNSMGGYNSTDYQMWKVIKRLHAKRLVKRAGRQRRWSDQFWYLTDAGYRTLALRQGDRQ